MTINVTSLKKMLSLEAAAQRAWRGLSSAERAAYSKSCAGTALGDVAADKTGAEEEFDTGHLQHLSDHHIGHAARSRSNYNDTGLDYHRHNEAHHLMAGGHFSMAARHAAKDGSIDYDPKLAKKHYEAGMKHRRKIIA